MQQRPTSCLSRAPDDISHIKSKYSSSSSSPRRMGIDETPQVLPLYFHSSPFFRTSSAEKLVHLIPFIVFLCLLTLWWFSFPVNLVMKDGKIVEIHHLMDQHPVNSNHVELAILASSISPVSPNFTYNRTQQPQPPLSFNSTAH